jgi:hypothetical protein
MNFFDRRLLFPAVAITAWAQQPAPDTAAAEAELRARAKQFFDLQAAKKYRQAEALVADESKDAYYDGTRLNMDNYTIDKVELTDNNTRATVTIKTKIRLMAPVIGPFVMDATPKTMWKLQNGEWFYFIDPDAALNTPFGRLKPGPESGDNGTAARPSLADILRAVQVDKKSVDLMPGQSEIVTVLNSLPGPVDIVVERFTMRGVSASLDKQHLEQGEKATVRITARADAPAGTETIFVDVSPLGSHLPVKITVK